MIKIICFMDSQLIILAFLKLSLSFKIDIEHCLTPYGFNGVCRLLEECVGFPDLKPNGCNLHHHVCCPDRGISEKKCKEYSDAVFGGHDYGAMNLMGRNLSFKEDECGILGVPLVIGGSRAELREFPHMASIGFGQYSYSASWMCGGSLISEQFVMSAAHCCADSRFGSPRFIKLGIVDVRHDVNTNLQFFGIEKIIIHPLYSFQHKTHDIVLLQLDKPVKFTPFARPACIDYLGTILEQSTLATGWGKTDYLANEGSPFLMKVQLDIVDRPQCAKSFQYSSGYKELLDSQLCAGVITGGKDTCQGDSGGPLQIIKTDPYCMYSVIGITSYSHSVCGFAAAPAIYTRVFSFIPWIESIVWPNES